MENIDYFEIDGKEYAIVEEIKADDLIYYYLGNLENKNDVMIRKEKTAEPGMLYPLDDENEVHKAMKFLKERLMENFNS